MEDKFAFMRDTVQKDISDNLMSKDSANMASSMIDVFEELMSKLERIAVATETIAQAVGYSEGRAEIWTRQS